MKTNVLEYLEETVSRVPDKIAFSDGINFLSFKELYRRARAGGSLLCRFNCYSEPILVIMDKHPNEIAAFLSIIYSGCFYVPVDAEMPSKRISVIAETTKARYIICDEKNLDLANKIEGTSIITFEDLISETINNAALENVRSRQIDTDPIYVVFTSGSTGTPKGVVACHRSVIDYTETLSCALNFNENNIFGNQTPLYFDAPLKEIMPTLKFGATTYFIPKKLFMFPIKLVEFLNTYRINTVCWVVSALTMISAFGVFDKLKPKYLTTIAFGSEVFPIKQFKIWRQALPEATFYNLYGPTEATGMSCYWKADRDLEEGEAIPIGRPFKNTRIMLIDDEGKQVGDNQIGEIYICGTCVTLGYYANEAKTTEAFVQDPMNLSYRSIVYKTGDLARYNEYGELVFVSRRDYQIKHMGHRIELGEIEASADSISGVSRACCIYDKEKKKIRMFYIGSISETELMANLKEYIPRYMLPNVIIKLNHLPLTPNGKLDRLALSQIEK